MQENKYAKLIAAIVGLAVIVFGIDDETGQAIIAALTALSIYVLPK